MHKRGQVTIFIILGIIVVVAVVFAIALRKDISNIVKGTETTETMSFQDQANAVKAHVDDCLEKSLKEAVFNSRIGSAPSITKEDYYAQIALLAADKANACIDFSQFRELTVTSDETMSVSVFGDDRNPPTKMQADARFTVAITKGADHASFDEFSASIPLKSRVQIQ